MALRAVSERKSGKQRRDEIKGKRLERAARLQEEAQRPDARWRTRDGANETPAGVEAADRTILAQYNNTYGALPEYYVDTAFDCRDCGERQVWTAKQQKWWYEVAHGHIDSRAVRCLSCRRKRRDAQRRPGSDLLRTECERIRALGNARPDADARRDIEAALANKWWGVRIVAIATLGRWGDGPSVARLKAILDDGEPAKRWGGWSYEGGRAATKALGECLPTSEKAWALDYCLRHDGAWALYPRLAAQSSVSWDAAIAEEWRRDEPARLQRLVWILRTVSTEPSQMLRWRDRFRSHTDRAVRQAADIVWRLPG